MNGTRRNFLALAGLTPIALAGTMAAARAEACYDPNALPYNQKSRRRSLGYVEASPTPDKQCSRCSFFTAAAPGCGSCQLLGAAVNADAVCNSFAPKAPK